MHGAFILTGRASLRKNLGEGEQYSLKEWVPIVCPIHLVSRLLAVVSLATRASSSVPRPEYQSEDQYMRSQRPLCLVGDISVSFPKTQPINHKNPSRSRVAKARHQTGSRRQGGACAWRRSRGVEQDGLR